MTPGLDVHVHFSSDHRVRGYRDPAFGVEFNRDLPLLDGYLHLFLSTGPKAAAAESFFSLRDEVDGICQAITGA